LKFNTFRAFKISSQGVLPIIRSTGVMMLNGIIGLFVGPIILAISYTLFMASLDEGAQPLSE
jgi:hypothetical protein